MNQDFDFNKLFIFEMANNHMGDLKHGISIIRGVSKVCKKFDFRFGFKLQYRDLDTFIHPDFKGRRAIVFSGYYRRIYRSNFYTSKKISFGY